MFWKIPCLPRGLRTTRRPRSHVTRAAARREVPATPHLPAGATDGSGSGHARLPLFGFGNHPPSRNSAPPLRSSLFPPLLLFSLSGTWWSADWLNTVDQRRVDFSDLCLTWGWEDLWIGVMLFNWRNSFIKNMVEKCAELPWSTNATVSLIYGYIIHLFDWIGWGFYATDLHM
jgi:hypothetical protein